MKKEVTRIEPTKWVEIKSAKDADLFSASIIAFQTNIPEFATKEAQWQRPMVPNVYYGYVRSWWPGDTPPDIFTIKKPGSADALRTIKDEQLDGHRFLRMRYATKYEVYSIRKAVAASEAELEFNSGEFYSVLAPPQPPVRDQGRKAQLTTAGTKKPLLLNCSL